MQSEETPIAHTSLISIFLCLKFSVLYCTTKRCCCQAFEESFFDIWEEIFLKSDSFFLTKFFKVKTENKKRLIAEVNEPLSLFLGERRPLNMRTLLKYPHHLPRRE